jgi:hypothetical protein
MESARLEQLERGLHKVLGLIERDETGATGSLQADHPAVRAADACELMLPQPLTLASLAEAARHKIDNVQVLLARAREHESLPPDAQLAADEGYMASNDDGAQPAN